LALCELPVVSVALDWKDRKDLLDISHARNILKHTKHTSLCLRVSQVSPELTSKETAEFFSLFIKLTLLGVHVCAELTPAILLHPKLQSATFPSLSN
jgi:hypothetical protein